MQAERRMVEMIDQHPAIAGAVAEIGRGRSERGETQHGSVRFDTRQQGFQESAAIPPGLFGRQWAAPPLAAPDQGPSAEIPADRRQMDQIVGGAGGGLDALEQTQIRPVGQQAIQSDDLKSGLLGA